MELERTTLKNSVCSDHNHSENLVTQPKKHASVFANNSILSESWYIVGPSKNLKIGESRSVKIGQQRLAVFRGANGQVRAIDAFCPHLGADLSNGHVIGNSLKCFFHGWTFDGDGKLIDIPCRKGKVPKLGNLSYPVSEKYGYIWVFSASKADHKVIEPPESTSREFHAVRLAKLKLFVHHHVMMANALDLQHLNVVHGIDAEFDHSTESKDNRVRDWCLSGELKGTTFRSRMARFFIGSRVGFSVRVGGGSIISLTYGRDLKFLGMSLPPLHLLWACLPHSDGVSESVVFSLVPVKKGIFRLFRTWACHLWAILVITLLKDDDIQAFPNMRFQVGHLIPEDRCLAQLIQFINQLPVSQWSTHENSKVNS